MSGEPKLLLWTYIPTHHQSAFLQALRDDGVDLIVHYFQAVSPARVRLGWSDPDVLPAGERRVAPELASLAAVPDWRERIHVIPGYGTRFLLRLAVHLSRQGVRWVNWCEPSRHWPRWYLTYPMKRFYAALINRYALGALAIGAMARQDFVRWGVDERRIRFLPYSVAALTAAHSAMPVTTAAADAMAAAREAPRFAFVGALCHRKGIDVLLKAFRSVLQEHPNARLILFGSDESNGGYPHMAAQLGIGDAVKFAGSVPATDVAARLEPCDILVLPSRFDGWGMVLNEAASLGKALIATESCGAAHHLIDAERNGFRVRPGDVAGLADAMSRYCRDPDLARQHGAHSRRVFVQFTPACNAVRLRECLASLSGSGTATPVRESA
jgi:glycosyltransferase involved in cell wall biosynthesis